MGKTLIKILFLTLIFDSNLESRPLKKQKLNNYNIKGIQNWVHNSFNNENNSSKREKFSKNFFCSLVLGSFPELKNLNKTIYHPYKFKTKNLKLSPNYLGLINISKYKFLNKEQIFGFYKNLYKDLKFIKKCEIHSFFYKNNSGIETIKYSFHLSGKTSKGYWFEEHSKIKVKFKNKQNWPESVLFERIFRSIKKQKSFSDITEDLIKKPYFYEAQNFNYFSKNPLKEPIIEDELDRGGLNFIDVNNDGVLEIYLTRKGKNIFYKKNKKGIFINQAKNFNIDDPSNNRGSLFVDLDNDGDLDLVLPVFEIENSKGIIPLKVYKNMGKYFKFLKFSIQTKHKGSFYSVSAADVDRDGNLDLYVSVYNNGKEVLQNHIVEANNGGFNLLFMNKGNFKFLEEGKNRGVSQPDWTFTSMFVDIDNDTDQDLYLANDWGDNRLYINNGKGYFKDISKKAKIEDTGGGMGIAVTDINKDGYFDFYISNMYSNAGSRIIPHSKLQKNIVKNKLIKTVSGNSLFINKLHNKKTFEYVSKKMKVNKAGWAWGNIAIDYDLDGDEDLYVVNGYRSAEIKKDL